MRVGPYQCHELKCGCGRSKSGFRFVSFFGSHLSPIRGKEGRAVGRWRREEVACEDAGSEERVGATRQSREKQCSQSKKRRAKECV